MSGLTLSQYKSRLVLYLTAEAQILKGQSYTIKDRTLTRADLRWVQDEIRKLDNQIKQMERGGGIRCRRAVPIDI